MVNFCECYGCDSTSETKGRRFHVFPSRGSAYFRKWVRFVMKRRKDFSSKTVGKRSFVCSLHFQESDYEDGHKMEHRLGFRAIHKIALRRTSVPSIHAKLTSSQPISPRMSTAVQKLNLSRHNNLLAQTSTSSNKKMSNAYDEHPHNNYNEVNPKIVRSDEPECRDKEILGLPTNFDIKSIDCENLLNVLIKKEPVFEKESTIEDEACDEQTTSNSILVEAKSPFKICGQSTKQLQTDDDEDSDGGVFDLSAHDKLMTLLVEIKEEQKSQKKLLNLIYQNQKKLMAAKEMEGADELFDDGVFPLNTDEAVYQENRKCQDQAYFKKLQHYLTCIGGTSGEDLVKRILKCTIGHDLALKYSLQGKNYKQAFDKLVLYKAICRAVQSGDIEPEMTTKNIDRVISRWLCGACDRHGGRAKRSKTA